MNKRKQASFIIPFPVDVFRIIIEYGCEVERWMWSDLLPVNNKKLKSENKSIKLSHIEKCVR